MVSETKIKNIIRHYKSYRLSNPDHWLEFSADQNNLRDAIKVSAFCINRCKRRHPHQYRIKEIYLRAFHNELLTRIKEIRNAEDFKDLFSIVDNVDVFGIGAVTKYDVAQRIGMYLKLYPTEIYLHGGTKIGAQHLIGKISTRTINKEQLPQPFLYENLSCAEIEDILCIYKDKFKNRI